jgi:hypothetical protein
MDDKLVKESLYEEHITKSYNEPLNREDVKKLIVKILSRYQKDKVITNMLNWLKLNNFGDYQHNKWIRAIIDELFKKSGGIWMPINTNLPIDVLVDKVMNHWKEKLSK